MTVLSTAQNIARSTGLAPPSSLVGNTNQDARRLLQALNDAGRFLSRFEWQAQVAEVTISASGADVYALPSDFRSIVPMTIWKVGTSEPARGPVRNIEWQAVKYGTSASGIYDKFHFRWSGVNQRIYINPVPATADTFVYLYRRDGWVVSGGTTVASCSADTDTFLLDDYMVECEAKWRFLKSIGQSYGEEKDEAQRIRLITQAEDGGMEPIGAGYSDTPFSWNYPERNFGQ